jgi:hypothetical protein
VLLSANIGQTEFYRLFVVIFIISFSIGCGSGQDIIKYQHSSKPLPLVAICNDSLMFNYLFD